MHRVVAGLTVVACLLAAAGCSSSAHKAASESSSADRPVGVIAVGHSGLTGFASDPSQPQRSVLENSWATGTNQSVNSVYQRLLKVDPGIAGHVANTAMNGSTVNELAGQITAALLTVPHPQLVIVQTLDNDIKCDGTDAANEVPFGRIMLAALQAIAHASPHSAILTLAQVGRPAEYYAATSSVASVVSDGSGTGLCDAYDPAGHARPKGVAALTKIVEGYESQVARACAQVPQCHYTDASARYKDTLPNLAAGDWNHLSVSGHAAFAALMWPTVARLLGLPR